MIIGDRYTAITKMIDMSSEQVLRVLEFTALHAFLLGLRTGRGLPRE